MHVIETTGGNMMKHVLYAAVYIFVPGGSIMALWRSKPMIWRLLVGLKFSPIGVLVRNHRRKKALMR